MKMLVVEDEPEIMALIVNYFSEEGWEIYQATDGFQALELFQQHSPFDTVILDWMIPKKNGLDVCRAIRQSSTVPILFLTAKTEEIDKLFGLEVGADDYITKPFSLRELSMRIRVILRRVQQAGGVKEEPAVMTRGSLHIFPEEFRVTLEGKDIPLTRTEFRLLETLATSPGRVYSRLQLLEKALGEEYAGYERSIDTHVLNLRKKIEQDPSHPAYVLTVFGIGYKWGEMR
ncbi:response regulator transcription factor [Sutcliffiella halmapala]|uniref:response regulator transcription factor n=1 Tax=Sutcliffiella halmapala TaxID=79882 RepID=UPI000994911D|nr:response regulator transcription factor [Sutcliffiella halmapala]